jgi:hypothetical protein
VPDRNGSRGSLLHPLPGCDPVLADDSLLICDSVLILIPSDRERLTPRFEAGSSRGAGCCFLGKRRGGFKDSGLQNRERPLPRSAFGGESGPARA